MTLVKMSFALVVPLVMLAMAHEQQNPFQDIHINEQQEHVQENHEQVFHHQEQMQNQEQVQQHQDQAQQHHDLVFQQQEQVFQQQEQVFQQQQEMIQQHEQVFQHPEQVHQHQEQIPHQEQIHLQHQQQVHQHQEQVQQWQEQVQQEQEQMQQQHVEHMNDNLMQMPHQYEQVYNLEVHHQPETIETEDKNSEQHQILESRDHDVQHHLHEQAFLDSSQMSENEKQYHIFIAHDYDKDLELDGTEIMQSLFHGEEERIIPEEELALAIDSLLKDFDFDRNGKLDFPEYMASSARFVD